MAAATLANNDFVELLHRCILDELETVIGETATESFFFQLKLDRCIDNPGEFHRRLASVLSEGAIVLEKIIVKELFRRLDSPYESAKPFEFEKCVDYARKIFAARMKGE